MNHKSGKETFSVSVAVLSQMIRYLAHLYIDVQKILGASGVDPAVLKYPDDQIPLDTYIAVENEAAGVSGDPYFGLHMGEYAEPGNYSIIGYIMMNSTTLGEALSKAGRYYRILGDLLSLSYHPRPGSIKIIFSAPHLAPKFSRHCFEAAFSTQITMMRLITGKPVNPLEVGFTSPAPAAADEYFRVFGCSVRFHEKNNYMVLALDLGNIPVLQPNPELLAFFEKYARDLIARIDSSKEMSRAVTRRILERLCDGKANLRTVAKDLCLSARTLQNRLAEEGETWSGILDSTRMNLAGEYLRNNVTTEEITMLLGFSESSVFRRTFKKWFGVSPGEYRTSLTGR